MLMAIFFGAAGFVRSAKLFFFLTMPDVMEAFEPAELLFLRLFCIILPSSSSSSSSRRRFSDSRSGGATDDDSLLVSEVPSAPSCFSPDVGKTSGSVFSAFSSASSSEG